MLPRIGGDRRKPKGKCTRSGTVSTTNSLMDLTIPSHVAELVEREGGSLRFFALGSFGQNICWVFQTLGSFGQSVGAAPLGSFGQSVGRGPHLHDHSPVLR